MAEREVGKKLLQTAAFVMWVAASASVAVLWSEHRQCENARAADYFAEFEVPEPDLTAEDAQQAAKSMPCYRERQQQPLATAAVGGLLSFYVLVWWVKWLLRPKKTVARSPT